MKLGSRGLRVLAGSWQPIVLYGGLIIGAGLLLWWQLGALTGGYSGSEAHALQQSTSLKHILDHPLNAPFTLVVHGIVRLGLTHGHDLLALRLASVLFGILTLSIFYWLVKYWHGERSAIFGTLIFGMSAWFLHTSRLGTPQVLLFLLLALVACGVWAKHNKGPWPLLLSFVLATSLVYVPGMIWFTAIGIVWQWRRIDRLFKRHLSVVAVGALLVLAILAPLGWAIYQTPAFAKELVGLPLNGWPDLGATLHRITSVPLALFWQGPSDPVTWLGRLPLLDAFSVAMFGLGIYLYAKHWRLSRAGLLLIVFVLGPLLIGLGGGVGLSLIVPFAYILVAAGTGFMLDYWYRVFPRNVIAQTAGTVLISFAVVITCLYHLRHYYAAWPNAPATRAAFVVHRDH